MSQCSYVNVKHTGTAELAQSGQPPIRLRLLLAFTAPSPSPLRGWGSPDPEGLRSQLTLERR